ncbi:MAG: hypothetical protein WCI18_15180 [Pseudomonadota bacterium]|jgi:hypothetical protein
MGNTAPIIAKIFVPAYKKIILETPDGYRYHSDLSSLSAVYCFPKNEDEWKKCSIDSYGLGIIWSSRFEVHSDQVVGLANKIEKPAQAV